MKASDFLDLYGEKVYREWCESEETKQVTALLLAFLEEGEEIIKARHIQSDRGAISVIREQNQKWNKLVSLMEKKYEKPILLRNGLYNFMRDKIKELPPLTG